MDRAPYKSAEKGSGHYFECFTFNRKSVPLSCLQRLNALETNNWTNSNGITSGFEVKADTTQHSDYSTMLP